MIKRRIEQLIVRGSRVRKYRRALQFKQDIKSCILYSEFKLPYIIIRNGILSQTKLKICLDKRGSPFSLNPLHLFTCTSSY